MADGGWTLYYSRNRSRLTYVCHSSVISDPAVSRPSLPANDTPLIKIEPIRFANRNETASNRRRISSSDSFP